jgi:hypothetical protein
MKRMILIVAIALLPVLSACFIGKRPHCNCPTTTVYEPVVNASGNLTNLELKYGKGKRLFKKPIKEGFSVLYRIDNSEPKIFSAIGDRVSDPKASYSGYRKEISGAGITSEDGLNVTSAFSYNQKYGTITEIRAFVNLLDGKTMYLSEVKNYSDANLLPLRSKIGSKPGMKPLPTPLPTVTGEAKQVLSLRAVIDKEHDVPRDVPQKWTENCWPCQPKDCTLELENVVYDPTKATIVCISCKNDVPGYVHTVCLANLQEELDRYRANGCEYSVTFNGISDKRAIFDKPCDPPPGSPFAGFTSMEATSREAPSKTGRGPIEETLGQLSPLRLTETGQGPPEETLRNLLTLPPKTAVVIITEYKINLPWK